MEIKTPVVMEYKDVIQRAREYDHMKMEIIEMHEAARDQKTNDLGAASAANTLQKNLHKLEAEYDLVKVMISEDKGISFALWYDQMREKDRFKNAPERETLKP